MTAAKLMRFFFNVLGGKQPYRDDTGEVFSTVHAAEDHAVRIAHELRRDAYHGCAICVLDAAGIEVARVPIGEAANG
jgi:uncharacterized protein DUF6894